jgi:endonuclease-3
MDTLRASDRLAKAKAGTDTLSKKKQHLTVEYEQSSNSGTPANAGHQKQGRVAKENAKTISKKASKSKEPKKWLEVWEMITQMRSNRDAPVDVVGCEGLSLQEAGDPKRYRFAVLLSLMLSSQTRDELTAKAMNNLGEQGISVENILNMTDEMLDESIKCVGFHNRKTVYIKKTAQILRDKYDDDTPSTLKEVLELPGVGPKMGHLFMQVAWDKTVGIGVDVHVNRICNRLGWVKTKEPEQTRKALEEWLPKEYWRPINVLLVGFGQTQCLPVNPKCESCLANKLCPTAPKVLHERAAKQKKKGGKRKKAESESESEDDNGDSQESGDENKTRKQNTPKTERKHIAKKAKTGRKGVKTGSKDAKTEQQRKGKRLPHQARSTK